MFGMINFPFLFYNIRYKITRTRNVHNEQSMKKGTLMKISLVIKVYERQEQQRKTKQKNKKIRTEMIEITRGFVK